MTEPNKLDQAHREVDRTQERLRDLEGTRKEAGDLARDRDHLVDADGYAAKKEELEEELAKARDEVRNQEQLKAARNEELDRETAKAREERRIQERNERNRDARERASEIDMSVVDEGTVEPITETLAPKEEVPETVDAVPVTPERQAAERQAHVAHEQPARQNETAKSDATSSGKPADREEQMAQRNAEINARVKAGKPIKPWNPVFVAKRAKSLSRAAKQKAAAAAIAAIIVSLGVCATSANAPARPEAAGATAAPAGAIVTPRPDATAAAATRAAPTAAPIGATIVVTPHHSYTSGNIPSCNAVQYLEPKTVSNPPVGASQSYEWQVEWPSCSSGRSWGIDFQRPAFAPPDTMFLPKTTYTISPLASKRESCSAGSCRQLMVVTVTNQGQKPATTSAP